MNASQLITYCSLAGTVNLNKRIRGADGRLTDFYIVKLDFKGRPITFQYHKDGDKLTFIKGSEIKSDELGTSISTIHGFKHLMKTLNIS